MSAEVSHALLMVVAVVAGGVAFAVAFRLPRSRLTAIAAVATAAGAVWALTQLRDAVLAIVLGGLIGLGLGYAIPRRAARHRERTTRLAAVTVVVGAVMLAAVTGWTGANSPSAQWFGSLASRGSGGTRTVALTFDDGPNATATLAVRDLLDAAGVKGTFFTVGKALDARQDISQALLDHGHLLGNHSYRHDSRGWLDPRYPELRRTQQSFARTVGVCPALFRPPHGQHTPFMAHVVARAGMRMVGWDVSAGDWATTDASVIARRVLRTVRPGSVIDLHDGLDGNVDTDRSVLVRALPEILDGLRQRGLQPVRLDVLLDTPGYLAHC